MSEASTVSSSVAGVVDPGPASTKLATGDSINYAAQRRARELALGHYENFTVVSLGLPRALRQHFCNIYAFCRYADDLADEIADAGEALARLKSLKTGLRRLYAGQIPDHWVLRALLPTARQFEIPPEPFLDLIDAFEQDRRINRYATYAQLADYCRRSANPVGHLVLYLHGYRDPRRQQLADCTCTALQLTNFWQDVVPDLARGRIYIPQEDMQRFGVTEHLLESRQANGQFVALMKFQVDRTEELFSRGDALLPLLRPALRRDVSLFAAGGRAILERIRRQDYDTLARRPSLGRAGKLLLLAKAAIRYLVDI